MQRMLESTWVSHVALALSVIMVLITTVARAEAAFIGSQESVAQLMRGQDTDAVQRVLENKIIQQRLQALGYTPQEVQSRLDLLSDQERHALATQIDELVPAGNGLGLVISVLIIVLLVVVILKVLDKRIIVTD